MARTFKPLTTAVWDGHATGGNAMTGIGMTKESMFAEWRHAGWFAEYTRRRTVGAPAWSVDAARQATEDWGQRAKRLGGTIRHLVRLFPTARRGSVLEAQQYVNYWLACAAHAESQVDWASTIPSEQGRADHYRKVWSSDLCEAGWWAAERRTRRMRRHYRCH